MSAFYTSYMKNFSDIRGKVRKLDKNSLNPVYTESSIPRRNLLEGLKTPKPSFAND